MAYKFISITPRADGGRDVIYDEDDVRRLACQIYKTKDYPQRFTWAELDVALANQLFPSLDKLPPPPDPRTPEEIKADRIREIEVELQGLDAKIPKIVEDLVAAMKQVKDVQFVVYEKDQAILDRKADLRSELDTLKQERNP